MNTRTEAVLIDGQQIGYQFNRKSFGKRRTRCIVHNRLGKVPWIKFGGMILEVRRVATGACEWEAVRQLPQ